MLENCKIHDPNSGSTYNAIAKIEDDDMLEVCGYMGIQFLGTNK